MKFATPLLVALVPCLALPCGAADAPSGVPQITVTPRVLDAGSAGNMSRAVPIPAASAPTTPFPPADRNAVIRRDVIAAVEQVLALHGNPPFAELVTNDPALAASLRARLDAVRDREKLTAEVAALAERRTLILEELARKEAELAFAREQTARLSATITRVSGELTRIQSGMAADAAPAPAHTP